MPVRGNAHSLSAQIELDWPSETWREVHVLMALSGGADSTALLRACLEIKRSSGGLGVVHAAHLNHGLRGKAADSDQRWVAGLCQQLKVPLWTKQVEIAKSEAPEGWEAAAREARYEFLTETAQQIGARYVATAHTANDQIETVLHRILRGTGIDGLIGIPTARPLSPSVWLVRPILQVTRDQVIDYLKNLDQDYCIDETNTNLSFTRNWIRNQLLPSIRERLNPEVDQALLRLSRQAGEMRDAVSETIGRLFEESGSLAECDDSGDIREVRIQLRPLANESPFLVREVCKRAWQRVGWPLRDMGYNQWQQLAEMVLAGSCDAVMLPGGVRADVSDSTLVLRNPR